MTNLPNAADAEHSPPKPTNVKLIKRFFEPPAMPMSELKELSSDEREELGGMIWEYAKTHNLTNILAIK